MRGSPGARAHHDTLRQRGTGHQAALQQLSNRLVGILHACLKNRTLYKRTHCLGPSAADYLTQQNMGCLPRSGSPGNVTDGAQ
jgi:hypothetical protein